MSFELALKEIDKSFTSDDGVDLQIRIIENTDEKGLLGFFKALPAPELMFFKHCLLYTSPSPRDVEESRMPSSA